MKDEKIIEYLQSFNFWGNENLYTFAPAPQSFSKAESVFGMGALNLKYFIINKNENGVAIIPFSQTLQSIAEAAIFIPYDNISNIYTEKYKFMFVLSGTRFTIQTKDNKVVDLEYNKRPVMEELLNMFQNK